MSQDWPFSVTSKVVIPDTGAEHLVTIRAATAADMRTRLVEASSIFPYAALITILEQETAQATVAAAQTVQPLKSNGNANTGCRILPPGSGPWQPPTPSNGNGNGQRTPAAAAVAGQTQRAQQRGAQARVDRKAALPHLCPEHGIAQPSKKVPRGYYCPTRLDDGSYCKWHWQEPDNGFVHPRDES